MSYANDGVITVKAEADLAACTMVKQGSTKGGGVNTVAAADINLGVTIDDALNGQSVAVKTRGIVIATVGASVAIGAPLKQTTAGKLITGIVGTDAIVAQAMEASTADGDKISVFLTNK